MTKKSLLNKLKWIRILYIVGLCLVFIDVARDFIYEAQSPFSDFTIGDAGILALLICLWHLLEVVYWVCKHYIEKNMGECCDSGECKCNKSQK